ncbi:MAG: amidase family protein [Castellaniella sp.]
METWRLTAGEVARQIQEGKLSAQQVARDALDRIEQVNGRLNALVEVRPDEVLAAAKAIDTRLAAGEAVGPLAGVPVTTKVITDVAGYATTNGVHLQKDAIAKVNSPLVDNILSAGAVMLGRTNTPAFSYRWFTSNLLHGATRNPHDPAITPGGSSGGAGAAVAAGMGPISLGTDIAGSIRYPAYACGIHGLRPTTGRVPAFNTTTGERPVSAQLMSVTGPMARSVADLRLTLHALAAPSARDPFWVPAPLEGPAVARKAALCLRPDGLNTAPEIIEHLQRAAAQLREAGWQVDEVAALPPLREAIRAQVTLWMGDHYEDQLAAAEREGDPGALAALRGQAAIGKAMGLHSVSEALTQRATMVRQWQQFLADTPVVLMPVSAELPFDDDLDLKGPAEYERVWEAQIPQIALPLMALPGLALCTGKVGTRPVGIQIVAGRFREDLCLLAGETIERDGHHPGVV